MYPAKPWLKDLDRFVQCSGFAAHRIQQAKEYRDDFMIFYDMWVPWLCPVFFPKNIVNVNVHEAAFVMKQHKAANRHTARFTLEQSRHYSQPSLLRASRRYRKQS